MKTKILFFLFTVTISTIGISAEKDSTKRLTSFGVSLGADYCYRNITTYSNEYAIEGYYKTLRNLDETRKIGYNFQFDLVQQLSKKFNAVTGVRYVERGYTRKNANWMDPLLIYEIGKADINYQMTYISIPLKLELNHDFKKFSLFASVGVGFEFMLRNKIKANITYNNGEVKETIQFDRGERLLPWYPVSPEENYNRYMISAMGELGVKIPFGNGNKFKISTSANYGLYSVFKLPIDERLWSVGLNMGIIFQLRNSDR